MLEDLHMPRAVHRLDREDTLVLGLRDEHVLAVPAPMARGLPQRLVEDLRRVDLLVVGPEAPAHVGDELLEQRPALGVPEHDARPFLLEMEQIHLAPEAAVVALLGLLELLQVLASSSASEAQAVP